MTDVALGTVVQEVALRSRDQPHATWVTRTGAVSLIAEVDPDVLREQVEVEVAAYLEAHPVGVDATAAANVILLVGSLTPEPGDLVYWLWRQPGAPASEVPANIDDTATLAVPAGWGTLTPWEWTGNYSPQVDQHALLMLPADANPDAEGYGYPSVFAAVDADDGHFIPIELPGFARVAVGCASAEYTYDNTLWIGWNQADPRTSGGTTATAPATKFRPVVVLSDDVRVRMFAGGFTGHLSSVDNLAEALDVLDQLDVVTVVSAAGRYSGGPNIDLEAADGAAVSTPLDSLAGEPVLDLDSGQVRVVGGDGSWPEGSVDVAAGVYLVGAPVAGNGNIYIVAGDGTAARANDGAAAVAAHTAAVDPHPQYQRATVAVAYAGYQSGETQVSVEDILGVFHPVDLADIVGEAVLDVVSGKVAVIPEDGSWPDLSAVDPVDAVHVVTGGGWGYLVSDGTVTRLNDGGPAVAAHENADDPHPQYLTAGDADGRYDASGAAAAVEVQLDDYALAADVSDIVGGLADDLAAHIGDSGDPHGAKAYADSLVAALDAVTFEGVIDCSSNPNYPAADKGHLYRVSVAGRIGGASGARVEVGDMLLCLTDTSAAGDQATVGGNWSIAQTNIDGAVIGPTSSVVDGTPVVFDGTSGRVVKAGDAATLRTWLSLVPGADVQAHSNQLDAIAALTSTTFGRNLLTLANVAALKTLLSLTASDVSGAVSTARTVSAGTGLTGGGDLSADRSLAVSFGTTAGTAAQGNDSRLSDPRTPTDGSVTTTKLATGVLDTDATLAANSDSKIASQKAVKGYIDTASGLLVPKSTVTTKGDLIVATGSEAVARKAVGADGTYLMGDANSTEGIAWVAASKSRLASATQYHSPESVQTAPTGGQAAAYAQYLGLWPCYTSRRVRIDGIATWCFTQESGSTLRLGIYACSDLNLTVGSLIADYGAVSGASTGKKEATGTTYVDAGWFFIAVWASNHSTVRWMRATSFREPPFGSQIALGRSYFAWVSSSTQDYSSGLPSTPPTLSLADTASNPNLAVAQYRFT